METGFVHARVVVVGLVLSLGLTGCGDGFLASDCSYELVERIPNPGLDIEARMWRVDCGATTAYAAHLTIDAISQEAPEYSDSLVIVTDYADGLLSVMWLSDTHVQLSLQGVEPRIFRQVEAIDVGPASIAVSIIRTDS